MQKWRLQRTVTPQKKKKKHPRDPSFKKPHKARYRVRQQTARQGAKYQWRGHVESDPPAVNQGLGLRVFTKTVDFTITLQLPVFSGGC